MSTAGKGGPNPFAMGALKKKNTRLEGELQAEKLKNARLTSTNTDLAGRLETAERDLAAYRARIEATEEFEAALRDGRFDVQQRSDWVRAFATAAGAFFHGEGAMNFVEMMVHPHGQGSNFGPLLLTFQRMYGKTPGMCYGDLERRFHARFKPTKWPDLTVGACYLVRVLPGFASQFTQNPNQPRHIWHMGECGQVHPGDRKFLSLWRLQSWHTGFTWEEGQEDLPPEIAELYEIRDPYAPAPDRLPDPDRQYVFAEDVVFLNEPDYQLLRRREMRPTSEPIERLTVSRGSISKLEKLAGPEGTPRWYVSIVAGSHAGKRPPGLSFADDGSGIPDWLTLYVPDETKRVLCPGFATDPRDTGPNAQAHRAAEPCCARAGEYNGYPGPTIFTCPKSCPCHD